MNKKPTYEELEQRVHELESAESESKRMLDALQQEENRYQNLFEHMLHEVHVWKFVFDDHGNIRTWKLVDANPAALTSWNKTLPEVIGKTPDEMFPDSNATEQFKPIVEKIYKEGIPHRWESYFPDTGQILHMISVPFGDYFISTGTDITDLKMFEETLKKREKDLRESQKIAHLGSWRLDLTTNQVEWTEELYRMYGFDPSLPPPPYTEHMKLFTPESWERLSTSLARTTETGIPYELQLETVKDDGSNGWMWVRGEAVSNAEGQIVGLWGAAQDITEQKLAEEVSHKNHELLKLTEAVANIGSWEWDVEHDRAYWSEELFRIFGRHPAEGAFPLAEQSKLYTNGDIQRLRDAVEICIKQGKPYEIELGAIRTDGEVRHCVSRGQPQYDENGKVFKLIGSFQDITERKKSLQEKEKLEKQLTQAQKLESIGTLAGGIAHDFNNILSSIIGFTELALDDAEKGSPIEDSLQEIYTGGKRARDLVKQILAFARQSDDKVKPIQIDKIAKETLKLLRASIPTTIQVNQKIKNDLTIMGNPTQVHQILMNICTNAAQAMEDDGGVLEISIKDIVIEKNEPPENLNPGEYAEIKISDTGMGIDPEVMDKIFDPYFTTKETGKGTGMGLALAHGIIKSYNGSIAVDSELGQGTVFTVYLPLIKDCKESDLYQPEILPTGDERILLIDDEAPIVKITSQILQKLGYEVVFHTSSRKALDLFRSNPDGFDLVITDMTMPEMTGDKLSAELISIRRDIPIILCTGYSNQISDKTAADIGIKAFAYKPVSKSDLAKTVRKVLDETKK